MLDRPVAQIQEDVAQGRAGLDDAVTALADASREPDLAAFLADRAGVPAAEALDILLTGSEPAMAVVCRRAGLSVNGYSAVLRLRHRRRRGGPANPAALLGAYRKLSGLPPAEATAYLEARAALEPSQGDP